MAWQLSKATALAIYDVLVREAGAHADERLRFADYFAENDSAKEWRFRGSLGFGGKCYHDPFRSAPRVGCYPEDLTPERDETIRRTNAALRALLTQ